MKILLGLIGALTMTGGIATTVVSCNIQTDSYYKKELTKLVQKVEQVVDDDYKLGDITSELKFQLWNAKRKLEDINAREKDYKEAFISLNEEFQEYQQPGYKEVKKDLSRRIEQGIYLIEKDYQVKPPELLDALESAINEAELALVSLDNDEVNVRKCIIVSRKLEYQIERFKKWEWGDPI